MNRVKIAGIGKYLPERIVTSAEIEQKMGFPENWAYERSGVKERRFVTTETCSFLGAKSLQKALESANLKYEDLDAIVGASGSFDHPIPYNSCLIQREMGQEESGTPCWDVDSTCLSFVTAMDIVSYLIEAGKYKTVAIVTSEIASKSINYKEKESATLLGDGSAAVILTKATEDEKSAIIASEMETFSKGAFHTAVLGGGNYIHPNDENAKPEDFTFHMEGRAILEMAFEKIPAFMNKLFKSAKMRPQDLDLFVPHQASKVALDMGKNAFGFTDKQFVNNIENHGNCIAASIPMALCDAIEQGRAKRGDKICLMGTAAGLSLGGLVLIY